MHTLLLTYLRMLADVVNVIASTAWLGHLKLKSRRRAFTVARPCSALLYGRIKPFTVWLLPNGWWMWSWVIFRSVVSTTRIDLCAHSRCQQWLDTRDACSVGGRSL